MLLPEATELVSSFQKMLSRSSESIWFQGIWFIIRLLAGGLMIHNGLDKLGDIAMMRLGTLAHFAASWKTIASIYLFHPDLSFSRPGTAAP